MTELFTKKDFFGPNDFPLTVVVQDPQFSCPPHRHQFEEIAIVLGGKAMHVVDQIQYPISERDVFVITGNTTHSFQNMKHLVIANILFDPIALEIDGQAHGLPGYRGMFESDNKKHNTFHNRLKLNDEAFEIMKKYLFELRAELNNHEEGFEVMAKSIFTKIVVFLSRCYSDPTMRISGPLHRITEVMKYIEDNHQEQITLDDLVKISHTSRRNLCRLFRQAMGESPINYLIRIRIAHACELLKNDSTGITQVAYEVGFQDSNYFSRQFKRITSLTPKQYRQQT